MATGADQTSRRAAVTVTRLGDYRCRAALEFPDDHRAVPDPFGAPLLVAYAAMPEPRRVAALGDCALGCNLLGTPENIVGPLDSILPVDLRIPGCPPRPDEIAEALLRLMDSQ